LTIADTLTYLQRVSIASYANRCMWPMKLSNIIYFQGHLFLYH